MERWNKGAKVFFRCKSLAVIKIRNYFVHCCSVKHPTNKQRKKLGRPEMVFWPFP